jgi:precorrin-3B synthase
MMREDLKRGWCPSLLRPMESGDGWLVRVRPRAAVFTAAVARAVSQAATRYGNGRIEVTNRANLQVRGLRLETIPLFVAAMEAAGAADEREGAPAILVSPLAGADPAVAPETLPMARSVVAAFEVEVDAIRSPKFGIVIDGGGVMPLTGVSLNVTLRAADGRWRLNDSEVPAAEAAQRLLLLARTLPPAPRRTSAAPALGFHHYGADGLGAVLLAPPFGQLQVAQLAALAGLAERWGDGALRPTPWKSLAVAGVAERHEGFLRDAADQIGIMSNPADRRLGIVTCAGAPACLHATVETLGAALALAAGRGAGDPPIHLSGCAKGCAHPGPAAVTLVGEGGRFAFIRDGRPGDEAEARGLTLAQCAALVQSVPA